MLEEQHKHVFHIATKGWKQVEKLNQIRDDDIYTHNVYLHAYQNKQHKTTKQNTFLTFQNQENEKQQFLT